MSAQEVPPAGAEPGDSAVKTERSSSNGPAPESSSPAEICVIIGESHNAQTPGSYMCGICGKKYKYYNCFQTHVRGHRESDGGSGEGGSQPTNNNFRYTCDICGKKYKYYSCFQEHRDLHAVDDPYDQVVIPVDDSKEEEPIEPFLKIGPKTGIYVCEFCGKQYKYFNPYQEHVALHAPLSHSFETQSPRAQQRLKDSRKHGNMKSDQIESPFSRKMEKKSQSTLGETNSSQNSSGAMCPLVSSSFPPPQTDSENHAPAGTAKSPPAPAPAAQEQSWKSPPTSQRNSASNLSSALPEKERQQLAERLLRAMCADLGALSVLGGEDFLRLAQTLVDTGARHGAYPLGEALGGGDAGSLALRQLPRSYNQAKVKVTCALGGGSAPGMAVSCHAHTGGARPCYLLCAHQVEGARLRRYVLGARELDPGEGEGDADGDGDEQLQQWAQNVLSEFVMPEARATYVTEPRGAGLGAGRAGLGAGPSLCCAGCQLGAAARAALARKSLQARGLGEIADLLDTCRHLAAAAGLPWDGPEDQAPPPQAPPPAPVPPCWDPTAETLLTVHGHLERIRRALGRSLAVAPLLQGLSKPLLGALASLLAPLRQAAAELSSDRRPTLQLVLPAYLRLEKHYTAKAGEAGAAGKLCHGLLEALRENFKVEHAHQVAMALDPGLKLRPAPAHQHDDIVARVAEAAAEMGEGGDERPDGEAEPPPGKRGRLEAGPGAGPGAGLGEARKEVFQYLAEAAPPAASSPLQYWRAAAERYPRLARLALWLLAVPAVAARPELAAACRQAVAMRGQQRLTADQMNKLIFLKSNTA